jgi:O-succinylbenzoate synthase
MINPQYIILKPSLVGGFKRSDEWIELADQNHIGWWITSALESNIGLNAIAQYTYTLQNNIPQGLGTGGLFTNNFESPLQVKNGTLQLVKNEIWELKKLKH